MKNNAIRATAIIALLALSFLLLPSVHAFHPDEWVIIDNQEGATNDEGRLIDFNETWNRGDDTQSLTNDGVPDGIMRRNNSWWIIDSARKDLHRYNLTFGDLTTYDLYLAVETPTSPSGLAWNDSHWYMPDSSEDKIWVYTEFGDYVENYSVTSGYTPYDLCHNGSDNTYPWVAIERDTVNEEWNIWQYNESFVHQSGQVISPTVPYSSSYVSMSKHDGFLYVVDEWGNVTKWNASTFSYTNEYHNLSSYITYDNARGIYNIYNNDPVEWDAGLFNLSFNVTDLTEVDSGYFNLSYNVTEATAMDSGYFNLSFNVTEATAMDSGYFNLSFNTTEASPSNLSNANFTWSTDGLSVQFNDTSTMPTGIQALNTSLWNYTWLFGDNTTSHKKNPLHNYSDNGTYSVTLQVNDTYGNYDYIVKEIQVSMETEETENPWLSTFGDVIFVLVFILVMGVIMAIIYFMRDYILPFFRDLGKWGK